MLLHLYRRSVFYLSHLRWLRFVCLWPTVGKRGMHSTSPSLSSLLVNRPLSLHQRIGRYEKICICWCVVKSLKTLWLLADTVFGRLSPLRISPWVLKQLQWEGCRRWCFLLSSVFLSRVHQGLECVDFTSSLVYAFPKGHTSKTKQALQMNVVFSWTNKQFSLQCSHVP